MSSGAEADRLLAEAGEKYQKALDIRPDMHEAYFRIGNVLFQQREKVAPGAGGVS